MSSLISKIKQHSFLFTQLVKRDFRKRYKNTILGIIWSLLAPLLNLAVMALVFTQFFGRNTPHYLVYLFCGNLVFSFFRESTTAGMTSIISNSALFSKLKVPKILFLLSENVASLLNFGLTIIILFIFVAIDGLPFTWKFFMLLYPVLFETIFNVGIGLILATAYVFFRDMGYLYGITTQLIMYMSALFYNINSYPESTQKYFYCNPVFVYIKYFRDIIIDGKIPSLTMHILCLVYALVAFLVGLLLYKKNNYKFLYYI